MIFTTLTTVPVDAKTFVELPKSSSNKVQLIDDIMQDRTMIKEIKEYMVEQYGENYQDKLIRNQLAVENAVFIESKFEKNKLGESIYPDYIGGLYINNEDNLVIQIVETNIPKNQDKEYENIMKIGKNASIQYVDYSYEELNKVHDIILNNFLGKVDNVTGLYVDTASNRVVVELKDYSDGEIEKFRENVMNSPMITFAQGMVYDNVSDINPGAEFVSSIGRGCSYGYRAKTSSGQVGIVSAGHCFNGTGNTIPNVGTVTKHLDNGSLDAAFIATNNGITPTNTLNQYLAIGGSNTVRTTVESLIVNGQAIAKVGYVTGYTFGSITNANYSYTQNGVTYTNLIRASLVVDHGDSGGIAVRTYNSGGLPYNTTLGIVKAKSNIGSEALITKASVINSYFGLSRY